jgi:hypothetical protein
MLTLLNTAAVPFCFPEDDRSIAARRWRARRLRKQIERDPEARRMMDTHLLMSTILSEAADAFQAVVDTPGQSIDGSGVFAAKSMVSFAPPAVPPNSPSYIVSSGNTFAFPEVAAESSSDESTSAPPRPLRRTSSFRKRRRVPSFKTGQTPRVAPKQTCCGNSDEADDEDSGSDEIDCCSARVSVARPEDAEAALRLRLKEDDEAELALKLNVLCEVQKTAAAATERLRQTDWAKVGSELRQIADKFSDDRCSAAADEVDSPGGSGSGAGGGNDVLSLVNQMLPFSVPQSLWSALVSYAAWKIFKRFQ